MDLLERGKDSRREKAIREELSKTVQNFITDHKTHILSFFYIIKKALKK